MCEWMAETLHNSWKNIDGERGAVSALPKVDSPEAGPEAGPPSFPTYYPPAGFWIGGVGPPRATYMLGKTRPFCDGAGRQDDGHPREGPIHKANSGMHFGATSRNLPTRIWGVRMVSSAPSSGSAVSLSPKLFAQRPSGPEGRSYKLGSVASAGTMTPPHPRSQRANPSFFGISSTSSAK